MTKLITLLENQITESDSSDSQVAQQRARNHRYYALMPLGNEQEGRSHYIDPAVFGSVEDKKAVYSESFLSSRQVVRFNGTNKQESDAKTAYAQRVLKANDYTEIFRDGWHDAFVAKRMTTWVDWRKDSEHVTLNFTGAPSQAVNQQLMQMGEILSVNRDNLQSFPVPSIGQQQFVHSGVLVVEIDKSYIAIDLIKPEYVMRDSSQTYARDALWNTAQMDMSKMMLIDWGFDEASVNNLNMEYRWGGSEEDAARKSHDKVTSSLAEYSGRPGKQKEVTIYKTRAWLSPEDVAEIEGVEPQQGAAIYEIYWGHGVVMKWADGTPAVRVLDEMAVFEWAEFKISHAESAMCTADVEAHQQKAGSGLKRGVMDNMNITNNPRWEANPDGIRDMRDLRDNAIGGIIETEGPVGQVKALDTPMLSPLVMGVMQMLDRDSEERSGMTDLARGMNMGAINNQNADSMVERLTSAGARRVAMGVRDFANTFFIPLLQCIVRTGMKNDKSQDVMESGGVQVPIIPSQWQDDEEMEVEVALTPDEAAAMSLRLVGIDARLREDEDMKPLYGVKQKHSMYDTIFELMGIKDSTKFLASPESPEYKQLAKMRGEEAQKQKQIQEKMLGGQYQLAMSADKREWDKFNWSKTDAMADNLLEDEKFDWQREKDKQELEIERDQERAVAIN